MKKILGIVILSLLWCSVGFAKFAKLAEVLDFETSNKKIGTLWHNGTNYRIWTKKDYKANDGSLRKIVSIVKYNTATKKKEREYFIIYNKNYTAYAKLQEPGNGNGDYWWIYENISDQWYTKGAFYWAKNEYGNQDAHFGKWLTKNEGKWLYGIVAPKKGSVKEVWKAWEYKNKYHSKDGWSQKKIKSAIEEVKNYQPKLDEIRNLLVAIESKYYAQVKKDGTTQRVEKIEKDEIPIDIQQEKEKLAKQKEELEREKKRIAKEKETKSAEKQLYAFSSGSGFITKSGNNGVIITNNHVVDGCDIVIAAHKGNRINTKIFAVDQTNDLAILKAKIKSQNVYSVSLVDAQLLEDVIIAGFPLGKEVSAAIKISKGSVSSLAGYGDNYSNFQTDAALNQGNSGGPIVNQSGDVIGVAVANYGKKEGIESFNFGVKSSTLRAFANSNNIKFNNPRNRPMSNSDLGKLITDATVFLECQMAMVKIKKIIAEIEKNRKAVYEEFLE